MAKSYPFRTRKIINFEWSQRYHYSFTLEDSKKTFSDFFIYWGVLIWGGRLFNFNPYFWGAYSKRALIQRRALNRAFIFQFSQGYGYSYTVTDTKYFRKSLAKTNDKVSSKIWPRGPKTPFSALPKNPQGEKIKKTLLHSLQLI